MCTFTYKCAEPVENLYFYNFKYLNLNWVCLGNIFFIKKKKNKK